MTQVLRRLRLLALAVSMSMSLSASSSAQDWGLTRDPGMGGMAPAGMSPSMRPGGMRPTMRPEGATPEASPPSQTSDRDTVLIARYRGVLANDPKRGFAFQRWLELYRGRDGNLDALVSELRAEVEADARAYAPRVLLGHVLADLGRGGEARSLYEEALRLRPDAAGPRVALADQLRGDDAARAAVLYAEALERTRDDEGRAELLRQLGELALDARDWEAARRWYDRLGGGRAGSVYLKTELARALAARDERERAIAEYERVLTQLRGDNRVLPPVLRELAEVQLDAGLTDDAVATLGRALRLAGPSSGVRREILDVLAEAHRRADRLPELITTLSRARDFDSVELTGRLHDELGDTDAALDAYRRALRVDPRSVDTRVRLVRLLSRSGRLEDVVAEYRELVRVAPREPRFVVELAQLLMQTGKREEALRLAAQTSQRNARDVGVHQALAELYARWGEDALATRAIATLVRIDPRDPAHLVALGEQQLAEGNEAAARATWRRILAVGGPDAHATLAAVLADHDLLDEAEQQWREALRADATRVEWLRGLATTLERSRERERPDQRRARDEEATRWWEKVLEVATDEGARREARQRIVGVWSRRNELAGKVREWRVRFDGTPPDLEAGRFLAEAYLRQRPRSVAEAEGVLVRLTQLAPGDVESLKSLERVRTARGDLGGAIEVLERLVQADPRHAAQYLQRMAAHAHALYRDADAVRYAAAAVERTPDDAEGHRRLGELYRQRQDTERAIASYRRALELDDRLFATYFELAELLLARGEVEEAASLYRTVVRTTPDDDFVARAGRAALQIHLGAGTLEGLERELLPLAIGQPRRPIFRRLVVELYDSWVPELARRAATEESARDELRRVSQRALKPLLEALADLDPAQQRIAVDALALAGTSNAAEPLLAAAEGSGPIDLRARALAAAGSIASPSLAPRFGALAKGPERRLRDVAAWSLARLAGASEGRAAAAVEPLRSLLAEGDPSVRAYAALGLGRAGDRRSLPRLEALLREDRSPVVQAAAAYSLGQIGTAAQAPRLVLALRTGGLVSRAAAGALGRLGAREELDSATSAALARALFDPDAELREAAAAALRGAFEAGSFPMPSADALAYVTARVGAGTVGPVALAPLREPLVAAARDALHGPLERVLAALDVLTAPTGPAAGGLALGPLTEGHRDWPEGLADEASRELSAIAEALMPDLIGASEHAEPGVRARVGALLVRFDGAATEGARRLLSDDVELVVRQVLEGLRAPHAEDAELVRAVEALATGHARWPVRLRAVEALGRLGRGGEVLARVLEADPYAFVREGAARALGQLGEGREALQRASADPEPRVRAAAAAALGG